MTTSKFFVSTLIAAAAMTATAYATDYEYSESSSSGTTLNDNVPNSAEHTITFCGASGYLPGYSNGTFSSNIILTDTASGDAAITINNGTSTFGKTQTFSGSISGSGTFSLAETGQTKATTYIFTGDVTAFTGNINAGIQVAGTTNNTGGGIQFGNGVAYSTAATVTDGVISNISGTGTITAGNKLTYNYAASESYTTLSIGNSSISAGTLTFQGGASYSVSSAVTAGTLTLSAGSLTLNGDTTVSSALSVASGTTLTNTGTLDLSGATVSLSSAITNTGTVTATKETVFFLANLEGVRTDNQTAFTLVNGGTTTWDSDMGVDNVNLAGTGIAGRGAVGDFAENGVVTVTHGSAGNLVWAGTSSSNTWNYSADNSNWTIEGDGATTFMNKDNVTFASPEEGVDTSVALSENIEVGTMKVSGDYTFSGKGYTLAGTTLTVDSGKTLTLANDTGPLLRFDDIQLSGTIDYRVNNAADSDSWSKLTFSAENANLYIYDNTAKGLSIDTVQVDAQSGITTTWGGTVNIGVLDGASDFSITNGDNNGAGENMKVNIADASEYTGELTLSSTKQTLVATVDARLGGKIVANTGSTVWLAMNAEGEEATFDASKVDTTGGGTLAGVAVSAGTLNVSSNIEAAQVSGGTLNVSESEITSMNISGGTTNFSSSTVATAISQTTGEATILGTVSGNARLSLSQTGTLNIGDGIIDTNVSVGRLYTSDSGASGTNTLNVNGTLSVTGSANLDANNYQNLSVLLGHWKGTSITNVSGVFNAIDAVTYFAYTSGQTAKMEVLSGGVVNTLGLSGAGWGGTSEFVLNTSGRVNIGSSGISQMDSVTLNGGIVGAYADWTSNQAMIVGGEVSVDTGHYDVATKTTTDVGHSITLSGVLSGSGKLIKTGAGTLVLNGSSSSFAGSYDIVAGVVDASAESAKLFRPDSAGWYSKADAVTVREGAELKVYSLAYDSTFGALSHYASNRVLDGGKITITRSGTGDDPEQGFKVTAKGGTLEVSHADAALVFSCDSQGNSNVISLGGKLSIGGAGDIEVRTDSPQKAITGVGSLVKVGSGTLKLSTGNDYSGGTTISAGTLVAANASALGAGAVTVEKDATLTFATTVSGVTGGVEINEGATFAIDLTGFTQTVSEGDEIGFTILTNTALTFNGTGANTLSSGDIESYFDVEGSTLGAYSEWAREWSYENNTLSLTMTIPEPSAFGLLAGVGALALVVSRRKRRK